MLSVEDEKKIQIKKYMIYFFLYSFLGWILETIYCFYELGEFNKRGFLYGPICPIYGFGALLMIISFKKIKGNNLLKFFVFMISFTVFEYITSYVLEMLFQKTWWDYSNEFMNFQGRVCLIFSVLWGIVGLIVAQIIHPFIERKLNILIEKIPKNKIDLILQIVLVFFIEDIVLSAYKYMVL